MFGEIPSEQFSAAIDSCAREVLAKAAIYAPPVDAFEIARRFDRVVARDEGIGVRARFMRIGETGGACRGTIMLADDPRPERRHWAVAHEIGEQFASRFFDILGMRGREIAPSSREQVANHLANALLLPRDWFAPDGVNTEWDLYRLKRIYTTASHELISRRMLEMSPPIIVTMFDQGQVQWRRSNAVRHAPRLDLAETEVWQTAYAMGQSALHSGSGLPDGIDEVRCWPIHGPGWRREIMRTALSELQVAY